MALKKMKESVERVFDKNLNDLVRGIRAHKEDEAKFIATCIDEIKMELRQESMDVKANALLKLVYLQMLGYDISWACFNMVEVTSSGKFTFKRIGYLAASQAFREDTDVIMLTTNLIKKDLGSSQMYDAANSLTGLSCFMTPDLAQDLTQDILSLLSSSKPYIRKKAVLIMYKVFLKYPEALRLAYPKLKERLDDDDPGVQCAAVNVICELARKNPKNYLALAPKFFGIMTNSTNNWMLIKIIKLFGALTPLEPRLGKKLVEPLTNLIHSTSAMSLLYECINTVVAGLPQHNSSIQLCVQKLKILIEDNDQNLKYLGLLAMGNILKTHPKSVQPLKDLVLTCLDDKDESIRFRALDLLYGMINKRNLMEIVKKLMSHIEKAEGTQYRDELLSKIIEVCSHDNYQHITNFEWYISILVELTKMEGTRHGKLISAQMLDVAVRVRSIRQFTVTQMALLVENNNLLNGAIRRTGISEVLYAAGWIAGEFNIYLTDPRTTLMAMLRERVVELPANVQAVYVQNALKLYSKLIVDLRAKLSDDKDDEEDEDDETCAADSAEVKREIRELTSAVLGKLPQFANSPHMEVQERACMAIQILKYIEKYIDKDDEVVDDFRVLFAEDLNPVAPRAQRKVPVPKGLDLDEWINAPPSSSEEDDVPGAASTFIDDKTYGSASGTRAISSDYTTPNLGTFYKSKELTEEELARAREEREKYVSGNMYYLKGSNSSSKTGSPSTKKPSKAAGTGSSANATSVVPSEIDIQLDIPGFSLTEAEKRAMKKKKSKSKKSKKTKSGGAGDGGYGDSDEMNDDVDDYPVVDIVAEDMPEGALESDEDDRLRDLNDPHRLLNFDDLEAAITFDDKSEKKKKGKEIEKDPKSKKKSSKTTDDKDDAVEKKKKKKTKAEESETVAPKNEPKSRKISQEVQSSKRSSKSKDKSLKDNRETTSSPRKSLSPPRPAVATESKEKHKNSKKKMLLKEVANMEKEENKVASGSEDAEESSVLVAGKKKKKDGKSKREKSGKKKEVKEDTVDDAGVGGDEGEMDLIDASGFEDTVPNSSSLVDISGTNEKQKEPTDDINFWLDGTGDPITKPPTADGLQDQDEQAATDFYLSLDGIDISAAPSLSNNSFPQFEFLTKDKNISVECKIELESGKEDCVLVVLRVRNCSQEAAMSEEVPAVAATSSAPGKTLKKIELIISDGVNLKMERLGSSSAHDPVLVSQKLLIAEQVDKTLKYTFKDIYWPQKVKGTITYIALTEDCSTHDKVDFKVNLPVSSFLTSLPMDGAIFKNLLASGELSHKCSVTVETQDIFTTFLAKFCHYLHFSVVEQIVESASLYSKSAYGDHICVLLKSSSTGGAVCCDMKCSTEKLLKHLQSEIEALPSKQTCL